LLAPVDSMPANLNFVGVGTLHLSVSSDGATHNLSCDDVRIGQGHTGSSNNWWFASSNCDCRSGRCICQSPTEKFTVEAGPGDNDNTFKVAVYSPPPPLPPPPSGPTLLTQSRMLMAHDAAMAYAGYASGRVAGVGCYQWKTQAFNGSAPFMGKAGASPSGFSSLLDCGVRALDLRLTKGGPCASKGIGQVCMHHSENKIDDQTFESELTTIVAWAKRNPTELVLLKLVPDNEGAPAAIQAALDTHSIASVTNYSLESCYVEATWTLDFARQKAEMPGGGRILATWAPATSNGQPADNSCVDDNFVPSIAFDPKNTEKSFEALWSYANETVSRQNRSHHFQELQLMWQSAVTFKLFAEDYPLDALDEQPFKYGNLKSTQESGINARVVAEIGGIHGPGMNLVKMNDICMHGLEVAKVLGTHVTSQQEESCVATCGGVNPKNTCVSHS